MRIFTLEHTRAAYLADFAIYAAAVLLLAATLVAGTPRPQAAGCAALVVAGLGLWTVIEYALHRFVLHGVPPFSGWHAQHHQRPTALIGSPTVLSALAIVLAFYVPAQLLGGVWRACALTLGVLVGYLLYATIHHATHHWRSEAGWLLRRKRWHARHHQAGARPARYGVTTAFWDHVFGSTGARATGDPS